MWKFTVICGRLRKTYRLIIYMTQEAERILEEAKKLSPLDRAQLLENLHQSFEDNEDPAISNAWGSEVEDRLKAYKSGQLESVSADSVFERVNKY